MSKIKGQSTLTKWITSKIASRNKRSFSELIYNSTKREKVINSIGCSKNIDLQIVSFSSSYDFNEQFFSVLSFVKNVGNPSSWIVYSDGTHEDTQIEIIQSVFPFLNVIKHKIDSHYVHKNIKDSLLPYKDEFSHFVESTPYGKKLFFYLNFNINKPTLFIDSDIVFYKKADCLISLLKENYEGWFLPDSEWNTLDEHYKRTKIPQHYQVNSGCFLCNKNFDNINGGLNYFKSLQLKYEHFTEQSVLHIILSDNKFMPLDPRVFILNSADQFDFSYFISFNKIALRHYTGPVRHKMWQRNWRSHLSL